MSAKPRPKPRPRPKRSADSARAFPCQLGHEREVMVTDATYEAHLRRAHPSEARDLGLLSR